MLKLLLARLPPSRQILVPPDQLATPSSTCRPLKKLKRPSPNSLARTFSSVRSPFSWLVSLRLPPKSKPMLLAVLRVAETREAVVVTRLADVAAAVLVVVVQAVVVVA